MSPSLTIAQVKVNLTKYCLDETNSKYNAKISFFKCNCSCQKSSDKSLLFLFDMLCGSCQSQTSAKNIFADGTVGSNFKVSGEVLTYTCQNIAG